jgi:2-keto-4-pentenoate hydratase/2-oxohepta-3-ene-1,7-dioic acid hydratase in catechol pathway
MRIKGLTNHPGGCTKLPVTYSHIIDQRATGQSALTAMQQLIDSQQARIPFQEVKLLAPVPRPGKFLGVGLNYAKHIARKARK